jgi:hypothetical protein
MTGTKGAQLVNCIFTYIRSVKRKSEVTLYKFFMCLVELSVRKEFSTLNVLFQ